MGRNDQKLIYGIAVFTTVPLKITKQSRFDLMMIIAGLAMTIRL